MKSLAQKLVATTLFLLAPTGCSPSQREHADTLEKIKREKRIEVCYVTMPPMVIKDSTTGKLKGHMIETLEEILSENHVYPRYHEQSWGTAALALQSGICDLVATGYFIKTSRAFAVAFTEPLLYLGDSALVRKQELRFQKISEANDPAVTIAVALGESGHEYAKKFLPKANLNVLEVEGGDLSRIYLEVQNGRADMAISDSWNVKRFAEHHDNVEIKFQSPPLNLNAVAWAVRQNDVSLLNFIENALEVMKTSGRLIELEKKYKAHWLHKTTTFAQE
ncbi:MAG: transporter substrate-binding domain-containing protein [bacterium]|nr:transporter substrate-binding domain-containing protein [bacterium]